MNRLILLAALLPLCARAQSADVTISDPPTKLRRNVDTQIANGQSMVVCNADGTIAECWGNAPCDRNWCANTAARPEPQPTNAEIMAELKKIEALLKPKSPIIPWDGKVVVPEDSPPLGMSAEFGFGCIAPGEHGEPVPCDLAGKKP